MAAVPYLIINSALNLHAVDDLNLRDRNSEVFTFTKRFCGSIRTAFAKTNDYETINPKMNVATAMAISAAAVAPNCGKNTNGFLVMLMALLNVRLGYWVRNPKRFGEATSLFEDVLNAEKVEVEKRRAAVYSDEEQKAAIEPSGIIGMGLSGGGIRSASVCLGVLQAIHYLGVFRHLDYLSTVSGGGYIGSGLCVNLASPFIGKTETTSKSEMATEEGALDWTSFPSDFPQPTTGAS